MDLMFKFEFRFYSSEDLLKSSRPRVNDAIGLFLLYNGPEELRIEVFLYHLHIPLHLRVLVVQHHVEISQSVFLIQVVEFLHGRAQVKLV